ncbi:MAG: hypothetical protein E7063_00450 [Spirochaetaceae bacterium]|nr:hypothetical protein [Spirochaetaceae bacterium]
MIKHPFRRFLGLAVLYIVIILGIFLLQFRSESSFSNTFGDLRLQLAETQTEQQEKLLKNRFQISYNGLVFTGDDTNPVQVTYTDGTTSAATLTNWEKTGDLSFTLEFDKAINVDFSVSSEDSDGTLMIHPKLPEQATSLSIPYKPAGGYLVTEQGARRIIISSKSLQYKAEAANITATDFVFTKKDSVASYNLFDPSSIFEFSSVQGIAQATKSAYDDTLNKFNENFIQTFNNSIINTLPEQTIVAYVAAKAQKGELNAALNQTTSVIKNSSRRTYLSSPFFNSLVAMNSSLVMYIENSQRMIDYSIQQSSLDIFAQENLPELLCIINKETAMELTSLPSKITDFMPTIEQAAGIIHTYTKLSKLDETIAEPLAVIIEPCLTTIATACTLENEKIKLNQENQPVDFRTLLHTGCALIEYGNFTNNSDYSACGYLILNTVLAENTDSFSTVQTMGEIYPILNSENTFYPHIDIIANASTSKTGKPVWAWTVSESIKYSVGADNNLTLSIDFPVGSDQYIIINGIESFRRIDIYEMAFRTDPRFETYSSSGYVYNNSLKTLFLKSQQRSSIENIKLYYDNPAPAATTTATPNPVPAPTDENTDSASPTDSTTTTNQD